MTTVIHGVAAGFGFVLLYLALFLYQDEEGKIQNILEKSWSRIKASESAALSKQAAFMRATAAVVNSWFDTLFTKRLMSLTAICVSTCYTFSSLGLSMLYFADAYGMLRSVGHHHSDIPEIGNYDTELTPVLQLICAALAIFVVFLFLGTIRIFLKTRQMQQTWLASVCLIIALVFYFEHDAFGVHPLFGGGKSSLGEEGVVFVVVCAVSVISDFSFIAINRMSLRWVQGSSSFGASSAIVLTNCALAAAYIWFPSRFGDGFIFDRSLVQVAGDLIAGANVLTACAAFIFIAVALLMIAHRVAWPLIDRFVYSLARHGIIGHKKALASAGVALVGVAFPGVTSGLKHLTEIVFG